MSRYSSEELRELAAGYALGAASAEESAAVEEGMRASPELAAEVAAYREVAASLATSRAAAPRPELRDQFLARLRDDAPSAAPSAATNVVSLDAARARRSRWTPALLVALAASLAFVVVLGRQNAALRRRDAQRDRQLATVLEAEKDLYVAQMTALAGDTAAGPGIRLFWNERRHVAMLHAFRLKPAPAGRSYQLWLVVDGKPVSAKVFNSDPDGRALVEDITLPPRVAGVTQVLLTEEPAGGSPLPTTTPFLGGALSKT